MSTHPYPNAEAIFYQRYIATQRNELVGVLLALFLGGIGIHHFYLRRIGLGILYIAFSWTAIPSLLGLIECFFMPGRVREFNAREAASIAASLGISIPWNANFAPSAAIATLIACPRCNSANPSGSRFCGNCGASL